MPDARDRLMRCFRAVFPKLSEAEIARASTSRTPGWDSLATTNLIAAVEEEFEIQFPAADIEKLNSFEAIAERLERAARDNHGRSAAR